MTEQIRLVFHIKREAFELQVDAELPGNGIVGIFGASGSGKTTLLRCVAGLEQDRRGFVSVENQVWQDEQHFIPPHKRPIGFVFQNYNLFSHLNVAQNLNYGYKRVPHKDRMVPQKKVVELLKLGDLRHRYAHQLSGGQQQRVAIGRALLSQPKLLVMDEPLASLDLESRAEILSFIEHINAEFEIPILYVSHSPDEIVRVADSLILMSEGRVIANGPINEILTRMDLPLAHLNEASSVIFGRIAAHDEDYHLTFIDINGGQVTTTRQQKPIGDPARIRILARDISLALEADHSSSILNVFPVKIIAITVSANPAKVIVLLDMAGDNLLAQITRRSVDLLKLTPGQLVYAQVKSVALMR